MAVRMAFDTYVCMKWDGTKDDDVVTYKGSVD